MNKRPILVALTQMNLFVCCHWIAGMGKIHYTAHISTGLKKPPCSGSLADAGKVSIALTAAKLRAKLVWIRTEPSETPGQQHRDLNPDSFSLCRTDPSYFTLCTAIAILTWLLRPSSCYENDQPQKQLLKFQISPLRKALQVSDHTVILIQ